MSGDMFSATENDKKIEYGRINLQHYLNQKCGYNGICHIDKTVNIKDEVCDVCIYKAKMDIPKIINKILDNY